MNLTIISEYSIKHRVNIIGYDPIRKDTEKLLMNGQRIKDSNRQWPVGS